MSFDIDFSDMLIHTVTVHRLTRTHTAGQLKASVTPVAVAAGVPGKIDLLRGEIAGTPVGTIENATHQWFGGPTRDVQPKDVLEVTGVSNAISGVQIGDFFVVGAVDSPDFDHVEAIMEFSQNKTKAGKPDA
jgi:hypothetical protein